MHSRAIYPVMVTLFVPAQLVIQFLLRGRYANRALAP